MRVLVRTQVMVERKPGFTPGVTKPGHSQLPSLVVESLEGVRGGGPQTSPAPSSICPYGGQPPE